MEKQYSLDLEPTREERISNSLVGQLLLSGIPNLNLLFEDEVGIAVCHLWEGHYIIHSELYSGDFSLDSLKEVKRRSDAVDKAFRTKGIKTIYTWAETEEQMRYNTFLGYVPTGRVVNSSFTNKDYPNQVLEYKKDLM